MIILRNKTTIAHLRCYKRDIINPYPIRTLISQHINMDSGKNQQKKEEVCPAFIIHRSSIFLDKLSR